MIIKNVVIKQLLAASEYRAMFADKDCSSWYWCDLVAWALIVRGNRDDIVGIILSDEMGGEMSIAEEQRDFIGFYHVEIGPPGEDEMSRRLRIIKEIEEEGEI